MDPTRYQLEKRAKRGFRGYPVATVAFYGPDDKAATKVAVGIILAKDEEPAYLERWFSGKGDIRFDRDVNQQILAFILKHNAVSVAMMDRIIGCPHEEGKDYPLGEACPQCPFWKNRDRWTGRLPD